MVEIIQMPNEKERDQKQDALKNDARNAIHALAKAAALHQSILEILGSDKLCEKDPQLKMQAFAFGHQIQRASNEAEQLLTALQVLETLPATQRNALRFFMESTLNKTNE